MENLDWLNEIDWSFEPRLFFQAVMFAFIAGGITYMLKKKQQGRQRPEAKPPPIQTIKRVDVSRPGGAIRPPAPPIIRDVPPSNIPKPNP